MFFQFLVLPLSLSLYNGTTFDLVDLIYLFGSVDNDLNLTFINVSQDEVEFTFHVQEERWDENTNTYETEIVDFTYSVILTTGIARKAVVSVPNEQGGSPSTLTLEFSTDYSTIDVYGNENTQFTQTVSTQTSSETNTFRIPGFTLLPVTVFAYYPLPLPFPPPLLYQGHTRVGFRAIKKHDYDGRG